jgi:oxygen-independent coproporphyrinogen-3 oxidase
MARTVRFDPALARRYDVAGPRYTSYPTAVQFDESFGPAEYRRTAEASNEDPIPRPLSLYVHIPFCTSPCFYCGCTKVITRDRNAGARYLARLAREVELQSQLFDRDRKVVQLHLGGGTPTFLSPDQLTELMTIMRSGFDLADSGARERSIEVDPRTADESMLATLAGLGFDRLSLGVQDFDPEVQAAVNRVQPREDVLEVIGAARHNGFGSIAVDLIYGLPKQTEASFSRTLDDVIAVRPERIAAYSYAHLPQLFKPQTQIEAKDLCPPEVKLALLGLTIEKLTAAGYVYIGMDHFAVPEDELSVALEDGTLQRNFQGYSTQAGLDMIGLGMSAIGQVGDCYAQNRKTLDGWLLALDRGELPIWRGLRLTAEDRLRRDVIQRLMCAGVVDHADIERRHEVAFAEHFADELHRLEPMARDGLVVLGSRRLEVTDLGRLLLRAVAMVFDAHLTPQRVAQGTRFSRVV